MSEQKKIGEFDIIGMFLKVWQERKKVILYGFIGGVLGIIVAFCLPRYYVSETALAPEFSGGGMSMSGSLADLASSFGVDLGNTTTMDAIYPDLYPSIISSTDFLMALYDVPVCTMKDPSPRTYVHHIRKELAFPFWDYPKIWFARWKKSLLPPPGGGEGNRLVVSRDDWETIRQLQDMIICSVDRKSSVISIMVCDQDPLVAAAMADTVRLRLQDYITGYRTNKAQLDIDYYTALLADAKLQYDSARMEYVRYADAHKTMNLISYQARLDELDNDMQLKYGIYTQTNTMLKQAEAKLQERTPAFTVLQRPVTPMKPSSMPRIVVAFLWAVLGGMICAARILFFPVLFKKKKAEPSDEESV
ncbi:MAG: chain-length determining protein [Bacteroidales bacterium]|nr:chain-length determining protein [Bacteroidales bacterium]